MSSTTKTVSTTIDFSSPGAQPPVYVAGDFTGWEAIEMDFDTKDGENHFHKKFEVDAGSKHQYKFRLGPGDWWVLNETAPTVTDDLGNRNNMLEIPESEASENNVAKQAQRSDVPILVVEKVDDKPVHGEDMGKNATSGQKVAHEKRSEDAQPDVVIVKDKTADTASEVADTAAKLDKEASPAPTPADTASEVADTAAKLDKEASPAPTPAAIAGLTGERRMSSTPIKDVARVASEVADTAAVIDEGEKESMPAPKPIYPPTSDGICSPEEFEARFEERDAELKRLNMSSEGKDFGDESRLWDHENIDFANTVEDQPELKNPTENRKSFSEYRQEPVYDLNDPDTVMFPTERNAIIAQLAEIRHMSMAHDWAGDNPIEDGHSSPSDSKSSRSSSKVLQPPTPVMDIISEEEEEDDAIESTSLGRSLSNSLDGSSDDGPRDAPIASQKFSNQSSTADSAISSALPHDSEARLKARSGTVQTQERPGSSAAMSVGGKDGEAPKGFLALIWRTIVVNWIGGFFSRLLGGRSTRRKVFYTTIAVTLGGAYYLYKML